MTRWLPGALIAASVARACWAARDRVPGGAERWQRTNHRGDTVTLLEGPAWAAGAVAGVAALPLAPATRAGLALATAGAAAFGAVDDLAEAGTHKGLRGHLGELAAGRLTTGGLKVLGIGATSLAAAGLLLRPTTPDDQGLHARPARMKSLITTGWEVGVAGALVAGAANLANLLDLRPGRVLKLVIAATPVVPAGPAVAAAVGSSAALIGPDLGERSMLGDCGANAAGALIGAALVGGTADDGRRGRRRRAAVLGLVVALTVASERISFTRVIEATPVLRELDALGRRPASGS